ncbi:MULTISPECIES: hypothetical protein [Neomoorella]|jgi:hypothetical protein|uniref:hypothetical protein n=1 Tax=Neomoorella TaxID=44260 RepID=UPI0010FFB88E|nr:MULTISPECIES: hypothetical protein [unclassified Moorella (in: firmicutes)]MDK2815590.1 hypothetical protein [Moorella sp. (in: firmicutes)]GEA15137.1 hypothetical protein E308F_13810 [Moorella sp. E308F]GEA16952.1 hypothetical protein E306M_00860 [Moorella sp. E306M]
MDMNSNLERLKAEVASLSREEAAELLAYIQSKFDLEVRDWLAAGRRFIEQNKGALKDLAK